MSFMRSSGTLPDVERKALPPRVTVLMSVYNGEAYVGSAIESILNQSYTQFEFLVVDDGSRDSTPDILARYRDRRLRVLRLDRNAGLSAALNAGLRLVKGEYVARQDADDISEQSRLEKQVRFLDGNPSVAVLGTCGIAIDEDGSYVCPVCKPEHAASVLWESLFDNPFLHTSVMFRKDYVWDKLGGYDEGISYCQDYDLWCRALAERAGRNLPVSLVRWRVHRRSMTEQMREVGEVEAQRITQCHLARLFAREFTEAEVRLVCVLRSGVRTLPREAFFSFYRFLFRALSSRFDELGGRSELPAIVGAHQLRVLEGRGWNRFSSLLFILLGRMGYPSLSLSALLSRFTRSRRPLAKG